MVSLVALLSSGKGTWAQVNVLLKNEEWDKVYLICNDYAFKNFEVDQNKATKLFFNEQKPIDSIPKIAEFFKTEVKDFEVAVNLSSGTGIEHMAVLSAILKSGLGLRFVYPDKHNEVKEIELLEEKFVPEED